MLKVFNQEKLTIKERLEDQMFFRPDRTAHYYVTPVYFPVHQTCVYYRADYLTMSTGIEDLKHQSWFTAYLSGPQEFWWTEMDEYDEVLPVWITHKLEYEMYHHAKYTNLLV